MAKTFKLGVSTEDREKEEAARLRELENEIQEKNIERNRKLQALNRKTKANRAIVVSLLLLFIFSMIGFGIYNIFIKKTLTEQNVKEIILSSNNSYNTSGIEGFIYNNINAIFTDYVKKDNQDIEFSDVDLSSIRILKIVPATNNQAYALFNVDTVTKLTDKVDKSGEKQTTIVGETIRTPYRIGIFVHWKDAGNGVYKYGLSSEPMFYPTENPTESPEDLVITIDDYLYIGSKEDVVSPEENEAAKLKVERVLSDLYEGKDTGSDIINKPAKYNTEIEFLGVKDFQLYKTQNKVNCNSRCVYTAQMPDGNVFTNTIYLNVKKDGNSYIIEKIL